MIKAVNSIYTVKINPVRVSLLDVFSVTQLNAYLGAPSALLKLLKRRIQHTILIDISKTPEEILQGCKSNTRNEIRRAIREGVAFGIVDDLNEFVNYYNDFASEKKLDLISLKNVAKFGQCIVITKSTYEGKTLSMHASLIDDEVRRASLLYSASIRLDEEENRKLIGMANRYLHYQDFLLFKNRGCRIYDFSGVCTDPNQPDKYNIGLFKKGFGGEEVDQYCYSSYPFILAGFIKKYF